MLIIVTEHYF